MIVLRSPHEGRSSQEEVIDSTQTLKNYLTRMAPDAAEPPVYIPTGVLVQSIEFVGAYNVTVTGYIWQKYADSVPPEFSRGVIMPEGDVVEFGEPAYRRRNADGEVLGWYFQTTLRQPFFYAQYPFDRQDIWLRLWYKDFDRNVILVPDFAAYSNHDHATLIGLENDLVLER